MQSRARISRRAAAVAVAPLPPLRRVPSWQASLVACIAASRRKQHDARQSLVDGLAGRINLFGESILCADAPTLEQVFVRKFGWSDRESVHAEMQRKANDFLLVDDRLFIAAGVPIVILADFMPVVGIGDVRLGETANTDAWDIEGWERAEYWADCEICADNFWIPGFGPPTESMMRIRLSDVPGTTIPVEAIVPEPVDRFQLRVDAAFRIVRHRLFDRRYSADPSLRENLRPLFERAQSHVDASLLTRRRIAALSASADLLGTDWLLERFETSTTQGILHLLSVANDSPHLCPEEGTLGDLSEWAAEDEDALSLIETG